MKRRWTERDGFSLIEALAAFAIVASASIVVQRNFVQSRFVAGRTSERTLVDWTAQSLLAETISGSDLSEGGRIGFAGGQRYEIRLSPISSEIEEQLPAMAEIREQPRSVTEPQVRWRPVRVKISVQTKQQPPLTVETVKLVKTLP